MHRKIPPSECSPPPAESRDALERQGRLLADDKTLLDLLEAVPNFLAVVNSQGQIILANRALVELAGSGDLAGLQGRLLGEAFDCVQAFEAPDGCGTIDACAGCGIVTAICAAQQGSEATEECRLVRTDQSVLDLCVSSRPMEAGGERFSVISAVDLSCEKRRRLLENLFFHDLLNTAGTLSAIVEFLPDATPVQAERMNQDILRLSSVLIDEIKFHRELAAAENNDLEVQKVPVRSTTLLRDVVGIYEAQGLADSRYLNLASDSHDTTFTSDPVILGRVLGNMVKNALEASRPGDTSTLSCVARGGFVEFRVHNPSYIPPAVQLEIFRRPFSTKGRGRGFGTYSMKLFTERYLGGCVSFTTSLEDGTTFRASFPTFPGGS